MSLKFAFDKLKLKRIFGFTELENSASKNVLLKVGFKLDKIDYYPGEENIPGKKTLQWYVLTKKEYAKTI